MSVRLEAGLGVLLVPATLDGKPARLVLDTGAERTALSARTVRTLGLPRDPWVSSLVRGVGGVEWEANALLRSFEVGGTPMRRRGVNTALSLAVAPMPWLDAAGDPAAGLLGGDYLSAFDLDLDAGQGALSFHAVRGCAGGAAPSISWAIPHVAVQALRPRPYVLLVPVQVDGVTLAAQLDTGASTSLITRRGAARMGLASQNPAGAAHGIGRQPIGLAWHRVGELRFGPISLRGLTVAVGAPAGGYPFDMLLGLDALRSARLWISYATNQVLVAVL